MRLFRWLLRLYPASFRVEYEGEMSAVFARRHQQSTVWPAVRKRGHNRSAAHAPRAERFAAGRTSRLKARITRLGGAGSYMHSGHLAGGRKVH